MVATIGRPRNHPERVKRFGADPTVDDRETPPECFDPLHAEFSFTVDAAAAKHNAKLPRFFDRESNGLLQSWRGERVWCNPPYSDIRPWVEKGLYETMDGCPLAVFLLPANRTEQPWWQDMLEPRRDRPGSGVVTRFIRKRIAFIPHGNVEKEREYARRRAHGTANSGTPFGSVLVVVTPRVA